MELKIYRSIPEKLKHIDVTQLHSEFPGPFLLHLKGERKEPLFLSVLLHGNETTGFLALQKLLKEYSDKKLPRDLIALVGNTKAAAQGMRHLENQPDFNRIWAGGDSLEAKTIREILDYAKGHPLFANIDAHNNTGMNPYYGCVNIYSPVYLHLASLFSEKVVYFTEPKEVESMAFAGVCPSTTVEAGLPGEAKGVEKAFKFIDSVLNLEAFDESFDHNNVSVFHTVASIKVDKGAKVDFLNSKESRADFSFITDLEMKNFSSFEPGSALGYCKNPKLFKVFDDNGNNVSDVYFSFDQGRIISKKLFVPSMFTKDIYVLKEDCLGYVMEKYDKSV